MRNDMIAALEAYLAAMALVDWKMDPGPVKETAARAAGRAEEHFFHLLYEQRVANLNTNLAQAA